MRHLVMVLVLVAWTYVQDNGVRAWTDDPEMIPAKYAEQAERVEIGELQDYPRASFVESDQED